MRSLSLCMPRLNDVYAMFPLCKFQGCRVTAGAANARRFVFASTSRKAQLRSLRCHFLADLCVQLSVCVIGCRLMFEWGFFVDYWGTRAQKNEPNDIHNNDQKTPKTK